jgi:hypothetical protein
MANEIDLSSVSQGGWAGGDATQTGAPRSSEKRGIVVLALDCHL